MIEVTNLTKKFDDYTALSSLNLHVSEGSVYGLVGPNGSGKTTLIKHIVGAYIPDKGRVFVNGGPVFDNTAVKQGMVYIPDDLYFPPTFSTLDMAHLYSGIYHSFSWERFHSFDGLFQLDPKKRVAKLSKGMQKQAIFWITISCCPKIIIMDEPVDGLDPIMRRSVWSIVLKEVEENGVTVLVSSHNLRELEDVCDHVGILYNGQMLLEKALDEVKSDTFKLQAAFRGELPQELAQELNILNHTVLGRVHTLILRGGREEILEAINMYDPVLADIIPLTLEEVFIYELGGKGYDFKNILL